MNFEKCFDILNGRQIQSQHGHSESGDKASGAPAACPCLTALTTEHSPTVDPVLEKEAAVSDVDYETLDTLELLEKFSRLQGERVMVCLCQPPAHHVSLTVLSCLIPLITWQS